MKTDPSIENNYNLDGDSYLEFKTKTKTEFLLV